MNPLFTFSRTVDLINPFGIGWVFPEFVLKIKQTSKVGARDLVKGCVKLNTDGAFWGSPGKAGAGGIFRDSLDNWICRFSRSIGISSSVIAECWADPSF